MCIGMIRQARDDMLAKQQERLGPALASSLLRGAYNAYKKKGRKKRPFEGVAV